MNSAPRITVVVCTFNHAASLLLTLESFARAAAVPAPTWELIVVDNNSSDSTAELVRVFAAQAPFILRYLFERRQGLSNARNCGLQAATGEIVAFTDDDVRISDTWIRELASEYADQSVVMVCGRTVPLRKEVYPLGIKDAPERVVYRHPCGPLEVGVGNNMSVRLAVARSIGPFDPRLGAGTRSGSAEDTDFLYRALKAGHPVVYTPAAVVYHDHDRVTSEQVEHIRRNYRRGYAAFLTKHVLRCDRWALRLAYWDQHAMWRHAKYRAEDRTRTRWFPLEYWKGSWYRVCDEVGDLFRRRPT